MKQNKTEPGAAPVRRAPSVRLKIFGGFLIFLIVTILLLWLFQVVFLERIYKTFRISELEDSAGVLASNVDDRDKLSEKAGEIAERYSFCISVMKMPEGRLTRLTDKEFSNCILYELRPSECYSLYKYAAESGGERLMSISSQPGRGHIATDFSLYSSDEMHSVVLTKVCEPSEDGSTMVLFLNTVIAPVGATQKTITLLLVVISLLLVLFALFLALFISRRIAKPIVDINERAKLFANGNYGVRFGTDGGYREINELSATLNYTGQELSKVDKLRRELIANISHDLRTPLTLIQGYSEAMRDLPGEFTAENIQTVIDETARLSSIVSEMLDYSKIESGNYTPNFEQVDLGQAVTSAVNTYRALTEKNGYRIGLEIKDDALVIADRNMILRALLNLVNNALTHTGADLTVGVRQFRNGDFVRIEVSDSGEGIPEDQLELIWERYYKADTVHKRAANGTGLGLSIVKSVVTMHNGSCGVRSTPGAGSVFWIELRVSEKRE